LCCLPALVQGRAGVRLTGAFPAISLLGPLPGFKIMTTETVLRDRSGAACELCAASEGLGVYQVAPRDDGSPETCLLTCETCREQIDIPRKVDAHHWRCLNNSMWSCIWWSDHQVEIELTFSHTKRRVLILFQQKFVVSK